MEKQIRKGMTDFFMSDLVAMKSFEIHLDLPFCIGQCKQLILVDYQSGSTRASRVIKEEEMFNGGKKVHIEATAYIRFTADIQEYRFSGLGL